MDLAFNPAETGNSRSPSPSPSPRRHTSSSQCRRRREALAASGGRVAGKSFSSRSSSSRAIRCRITHLRRSGLASAEVGISWVRLLTSEWVLGRVSFYFDGFRDVCFGFWISFGPVGGWCAYCYGENQCAQASGTVEIGFFSYLHGF
jgi:hypothetical protein